MVLVEDTTVRCHQIHIMPKVLRGGKWGSVQSRSTSNTIRARTQDSQDDSENATDDGRMVHHLVPTTTKTQSDREIFLSHWNLMNADYLSTASRCVAPVAVQQLILCFVEERKQLGIAGYDISANEIQISKVPVEDDYADVTGIVSSLAKCHVILPASYKNNGKLLRALAKAKRSTPVPDNPSDKIPNSEDGSETGGSKSEDLLDNVTIFHLPNRDFGLGRAAELCSLITVLGMPPGLQPDERISFLSHVLQDDSCVMRSVGGLLSFIIGNGLFGSLMEDDNSISLNAISRHNYGDVVKMTSTTLRALHVFSQDTHPVGRGSLRGKEGFSLFGILKSFTKTPAARKMLRMWLQYPSTNLEKIQQRQFLVDVMKRSSNRAFLITIKESLRGVKSVPAILNRLKQVCADSSDWKALYSSTKSFVALLETLKVATQQDDAILKSNLIADVISIADTPLRETVSWIDAVADLEESSTQGRMIVAPGFSEEIDELKRSYAALDDFLTKIGVQELKALESRTNAIGIESLNATYEPQIGFLIALSEEECEKVGQDVLEEQGLSFVFRSEDHRYFKNERCRELDTDPGDIHGQICDLEAKAFRYVVAKILDCAPALLKMFRLVTELDCLQALASAAVEYDWVRPSISTECTDLEIEDGRHPLLELAVPSFVPNSTKMRRGDVNVLTGPNYSGKSVYLSQVALIIILAQVGSFVPARKARIGLIGGINSRISSFESVTFGQSSFFADAAQVASMLTRAPKWSLNLIDEFGKGTLEVDGMALLISVLRAFLRMEGSDAPFTICATHFTEILKEPFLPLDNCRLGLYSMEVMTKIAVHADTITKGGSLLRQSSSMVGTGSASGGGSEKIGTRGKEKLPPDNACDISAVIRTYRILPGSICTESRALQCALEAGVEKPLLERAAHIRPAIAKDGKIENVVATPANNPRIKDLTNKVREFKKTTIDEETV